MDFLTIQPSRSSYWMTGLMSRGLSHWEAGDLLSGFELGGCPHQLPQTLRPKPSGNP